MRFAGLQGLLLLSLLQSFAPMETQARTAPSNEIRVTLFGQPCSLRGPVDERMLKIIHLLSPEQLYPERDSPLTSGPTRKALDKLRAATGAPSGLDRYRERATKRLEAQLAFIESIESIEKPEKEHKIASLLETGKSHLTGSHLKDFEAAVKKAEAAKTLSRRDTIDSLFDTYSDGIEADPEEEFHRAIQRLNVQYVCLFEGNGEGASDASD